MPTTDDYTFVSFTQGTDNNTDPTVVVIIVKYNGQEICLPTGFVLDISIAQDSQAYFDAMDAVIADVRVHVPAEIENPDYDPVLTACWT